MTTAVSPAEPLASSPSSSTSVSYDVFEVNFHDLMTRDPNSCVVNGIDRYLGELPDPTLEAHRTHVELLRGLLGLLPFIPRDGLTFDQRLQLDLAGLILQNEIEQHTRTLAGRPEIAQKPTAGDDIGDGIMLLFVQDRRLEAERLENILSRIEAIPTYLMALLARLDTPVKRWVNIDLKKVEGLPGFLETLVGWAEGIDWPKTERLRAAVSAAAGHLGRYAEALAQMPTHDDLHVGRKTAEAIVANNGIDLTLEQIHANAVAFFAGSADEIEALRVLLLEKYGLDSEMSAKELQAWLKKHFALKLKHDKDYEGVLERYRAERARVLAWIEERDLFPIPDDQDMLIIQTPAFMMPSIPAGAMMPARAFASGTALSIVYLTLSPELLDEHTELSISSMMIHEGIPGHHLDFAWHARHPSVIRRHGQFTAGCEGWTTMLERYMLDQGYGGELTDEIHFMNLHELQRLGARVGIDLFFMTGDRKFLSLGIPFDDSSDDPFVLAGNLLVTATGFTEGRAQSELNWYSQERGYPLSYLTGNKPMWQLREDVAKANAAKPSGERLEGLDLDRRFHAVFLRAGNLPMPFIRRVFKHEGLL